MLLGIKPFLGQCNPVLEIWTKSEATHRAYPAVRRDVCSLRHWVFRCLVKGLVSIHYSLGGHQNLVASPSLTNVGPYRPLEG